MPNYYIFVVGDEEKDGTMISGIQIFRDLINKKVWGFYEKTVYRAKIKEGDKAVFYLAGPQGKKFLAEATLASGAYQDSSCKDLFLRPDAYRINLRSIKVWDNPKPIDKLVKKLDFIKDKKLWGPYLQGGCKKISAKDYQKITESKVKEEPKGRNYWVVHMGRGGKYAQFTRTKHLVALGWDKISDLRSFKSLNELKSAVKKQYPDSHVPSVAGQLNRFLREVNVGDVVLVPIPSEREVIVGQIASEYYYGKAKDFAYPHRRKIKIIKVVSRDDFSQPLKFAVGGALTLFIVNNHGDEIDSILGGKHPPLPPPESVYAAVINNLFAMSPREFEQFICAVLKAMGFEAEETPYSGDRGVDVIGILSAEGLAQIRLKAQVKRVQHPIGNDEILKLRGTLEPDEQGCFITLSQFTKSAIEESEDEKKKPIKIIDGKDLVDLILSHYDELDEQYKGILGVKKKKLPVTEQFTV